MTNVRVATHTSKGYHYKQPDMSFKESVYKNAVLYGNRMEARNFPFLENAQTGSIAHPTSYLMGTRELFQGIKRPQRDVDLSLPYSVEVKNGWSYTFTLSVF